MTKSYLKKFSSLKTPFTLKGNFIFVEKVQLPEVKTASGIIMAGGQLSTMNEKHKNPHIIENKMDFYRVVLVGEGYSDPQESMDVELGSIVLLPPGSVKIFKEFHTFKGYLENSLGLSTDADCQMIFKKEEDFENFFKELNGD